MHPDSPIMEVYNSSWRKPAICSHFHCWMKGQEIHRKIMKHQSIWRYQFLAMHPWNVHFGNLFFTKTGSEQTQQSASQWSQHPQPGCCNFLIFYFFIWKSYREGNQCCFAVATGVIFVDSLAVPWIAAFPESHTNANVPVRKSLEIYLQFWNPWLSCSSKNAAICRVSKTSIAQIFPPSPSQTHQVFQHLLCAGLRDLWPLHGKLKIRYWDGKVSTSDIPFHSVVNGKTHQQIAGVQSETIY